MRRPDPIRHMLVGIRMADQMHEHGETIEGGAVVEVGTGWRLNLPIALWLCGASEIVTVDLNPYLKEELVREDICYVRRNQQKIRSLIESRFWNPGFQERFEKLIELTDDLSLDHILDTMNIRYMAPADASRLDLPPRSVHFHVSYTVLEHIPPQELDAILLEGKRLLVKGGLLVHLVGLSDHFSHSDKTISTINFLRFTDGEWERYAGNRYMYHNRLRVDDFLDLFEKVGLSVTAVECKVDQRALEELTRGFPLDERFRDKSPHANATESAWIVAKH